MSNRDKRLLATDEQLRLNIFRAFCCVHIKRNLISRDWGSKTIISLFWRMVHAKNEPQYATAPENFA